MGEEEQNNWQSVTVQFEVVLWLQLLFEGFQKLGKSQTLLY